MAIDVRALELADGKIPFEEWYRSIRDAQTRTRVAVRLARVRSGNLGDSRSVGGGVHELRIDTGPGYRIYFGWRGSEVVVLIGGGHKGRQARDIAMARRLWEEYADEDQGLV